MQYMLLGWLKESQLTIFAGVAHLYMILLKPCPNSKVMNIISLLYKKKKNFIFRYLIWILLFPLAPSALLFFPNNITSGPNLA